MDSIIFDVDGTLWNSTDIVARAWDDYIRNTEGLDITITADKLMSLFGQLMEDIAKQVFPEQSPEEQRRLMANCCKMENAVLRENCAPLYPDLEKTLRILSSRLPLFIVSNCHAGYIEVFLEATGFHKYFKGHLCPGDTGLDKAGNISRIAEEYHLQSPVYVGDTMGDYTACRKAGVPFVFASYGFGDVTEPDYTISCPADLIDLLPVRIP